MQTSDLGVAAIKIHEYVVLRAYKCPAGKVTIGAGLTAASGVVTPVMGMEITHEEADELLHRALARNYEPAVNSALKRNPLQHEFDAAVSFHFNTGAISTASWVGFWNKTPVDWAQVERRFKSWNKAKGKVLTGLVNRRKDEFTTLRHGIYPVTVGAMPSGLANFAHRPSDQQLVEIRRALTNLGFNVGTDTRGVATDAVKGFQEKYDLRVDGIVGPATLNTLQRVLDEQSNPLMRFIRKLL